MQQAESLIEFRKVLELGLVSLAAEKATDSDWETMREILAEQEDAALARVALTFTSASEMPTSASIKLSLRPREILLPLWCSKPSLRL